MQPDGSAVQPSFVVERERLAAAMYSAGLAVPANYDAPRGRPDTDEERAYMRSRGQGDGRRVPRTTVPRMLRRDAFRASDALQLEPSVPR